jgi:hypothetical protein
MPGLGPAAAGQLAAEPLPGQARAGQGPGPRRHQHRQHREGRPPGLVHYEYTSKGNTMQYQEPWRSGPGQAQRQGQTNPGKHAREPETHRFPSFNVVLIYTVWKLQGNEVIADENELNTKQACSTCT